MQLQPTAAQHDSGGHGVGGALTESLAGPLHEACGGRLSDLAWFRTDWQRGGAATARARWDRGPDGGGAMNVVVKVPVNARELQWMRRLQDDGQTLPRLMASGDSLAAYDLGWIVIEHLPHGPLATRWHDDHVPRVAAAVARFAQLASRHPVDREPRREPWEQLVATAREHVKMNGVDGRPRWTAALRALTGRLDDVVAEWEARAPLEWVHGDLHLGNAMGRDAIDRGTVCLIDLAEVRPGHWVEDAICLERPLWARPERLRPHKPVRAIADARRAVGIGAGEEVPRLATIRRMLLAATAPAFLRSEGAPSHLAACLERLETGLRDLR